MADLAKMRTAAQAGNLLQEPSAGGTGTIGQLTEVAKAFGMDMPKMAQERDKLLVELSNAKNDAQKAEAKAELSRVESQIEGLKTMLSNNQAPANDPLRDMAVEMAKTALQNSQGGGDSNDPVASAYKQFVMNKTLEDLEAARNPVSVQDQVGGAVETLRAIRELGAAFAPPAPPPAPQSTFSPEKQMELELKKLEIEQQLEIYRINKENEAATQRASSMQDAIKMVGNALEGIGKSVADSLLTRSSGYVPSADIPTPDPSNMIDDSEMIQSPSDVGEEDDALVGKLECPDCGQEAVYVTARMYNAGQRGEKVEAACVACGSKHELGDSEPEDDQTPVQPQAFAPPKDAPPPVPTGVRETDLSAPGTTRNGKERPQRRNFVSVD
tara:strand:- start:1522 stop:2673 length:1152 start_codon:yes stop_codon:yes gene_type:complete